MTLNIALSGSGVLPDNAMLVRRDGANLTEVKLSPKQRESRTQVAQNHCACDADIDQDAINQCNDGYGAFKGAVMGSVATRVVAKGEIPLLSTRSVAR